MKNKIITAFALLLFSSGAFSQESKFKLGIRFAPNLAMTRVIDVEEKDGISMENNGVGLRFSAGLTGDFYFGKNYSFYTGLWYTTMRSGVKFSTNGSIGNFSGESVYNLQYVQVPVAIKLFTNEIATDTKLYFVLGGTAGFKINEKDVEWKSNQNADEPEVFSKPGKGTAYSLFDAGLLLTAGAEYQLGENTTLFGGLSFNRGLFGVQSKKGPFNSDEEASKTYTVSHQLLSLEVGLKF